MHLQAVLSCNVCRSLNTRIMAVLTSAIDSKVLLRLRGQVHYQSSTVKGLVMQCIRCGSGAIRKDGHTRLGGQRWRCNACQRRFTARSSSAFANLTFPDDVIALAVRWYVRYRLSYADVVEWFAERGLTVDRNTVYRWVQRILPLLQAAATHTPARSKPQPHLRCAERSIEQHIAVRAQRPCIPHDRRTDRSV